MAFLARKSFVNLAITSSRRVMSSIAAPLLLSPTQVRDLSKSNKPVTLLDASWVMPNSPRNPHDEFLAKRIPGAQFLDIDQVSSPHELGLKHMMPTERVFADACGMFFNFSDRSVSTSKATPREIWN
jgi:thiosulfate/3-mercaptopyruvate sulfurtransferase